MRSEQPRSRLVRLHSRPGAWLILAAGIGLTAMAWKLSSDAHDERVRTIFETRAEEITDAIANRMTEYEQVLWGGAGLFDAVGRPDRQMWRRYVEALDLETRWPGIQGIGYAEPVARDAIATVEAQARLEGVTGFEIRPKGERAHYTTILYLEPLDWRNRRAIGYDMYSNAERREAMDRARAKLVAATSARIRLVQETTENVQAGFLMYVPVFHGASRDTFRGWVYAAFRAGDLMKGILGKGPDEIRFAIFDAPVPREDALLHSSAALPEGEVRDRTTRQLSVQGRDWTLEFAATPEFRASRASSQPLWIAFGGIVIEVLLFYLLTTLSSLHEQAQRIADKRTREVRAAHESLARQARELRRSNDELRQFAHATSHDLQEPLRSMCAFSEMLQANYAGALDERGLKWLGFIETGAARMRSLVRDLLEYSTVGTGEVVLETLPLSEQIEQARALTEAALQQADAQLTLETPHRVHGAPDQVLRLFTNLISNAVKYADPSRKPEIRITSQAEGDHIRVEVADNGIGVDPRFHERIFEIFRRAASGDGTGIGLALCRRIVRAHGGEIGIESQQGIGSVFWFTLPAAPTARSTDPDKGTA